MSKKGSALLWIVAIVVILVLAGIITVPQFKVPEAITPTPGVQCPDTMQTSLEARATNPLNASLEYTQATVYYGRNDKTEGSAQLNYGDATSPASFKQLTSSAQCGDKYSLWTINSGSHVAISDKDFLVSGTNTQRELSIPESSQLEFAIYDSSWNNITGDTDDWVQDASSSTQTWGSGESYTFYLKAKTTSSSAQFGSDELATHICIDFNTGKYSKDNGIVITGGTAQLESTIPSYCSSNGYDKAYKINPVKSTEGERVFTISIRTDLGDPGASDDIKFLFVDEHYYISTDGTVKSGTADDTITAVGETDNYVTIDVA